MQYLWAVHDFVTFKVNVLHCIKTYFNLLMFEKDSMKLKDTIYGHKDALNIESVESTQFVDVRARLNHIEGCNLPS